MKIYGICGSPRNDTTQYVLEKALENLKNDGFETKLFSCAGKSIAPCMHCDYCMTHKECVNKDDMTEVYEGLKEADGLIFATPLHSGGISAETLSIFERTRALEAVDINLLRGKIGMSIAVGGDRDGGQSSAHLQIITYYMIHGIIPVSGGGYGANLGASFWSQDSLDKVKDDKYGFESLERTVKEFKDFLNKIRPNF
ncbi:MAG: flavodoxin family protein [Methanobrevibacter sp.]|uniref:flavodoxin family protein n=1 Tax=Methanobrevibacter sp. TaxID=66852 RepID=UPI0026DF1876|nr:flavodoxin family protein [Methanobrevibacter sp.]MDO5847942.1 flavodoxin family protein [Methanobrevibacter sp.]